MSVEELKKAIADDLTELILSNDGLKPDRDDTRLNKYFKQACSCGIENIEGWEPAYRFIKEVIDRYEVKDEHKPLISRLLINGLRLSLEPAFYVANFLIEQKYFYRKDEDNTKAILTDEDLLKIPAILSHYLKVSIGQPLTDNVYYLAKNLIENNIYDDAYFLDYELDECDSILDWIESKQDKNAGLILLPKLVIKTLYEGADLEGRLQVQCSEAMKKGLATFSDIFNLIELLARGNDDAFNLIDNAASVKDNLKEAHYLRIIELARQKNVYGFKLISSRFNMLSDDVKAVLPELVNTGLIYSIPYARDIGTKIIDQAGASVKTEIINTALEFYRDDDVTFLLKANQAGLTKPQLKKEYEVISRKRDGLNQILSDISKQLFEDEKKEEPKTAPTEPAEEPSEDESEEPGAELPARRSRAFWKKEEGKGYEY